MKEIFKIILSFAIAIFIFSSCTEDANLPTPDGVVKGTYFSINANESSDGNINVFDFASVQLAIDVELIEGDYSSVEVMFSINGDYANQYKIADVTTVPSTVNFDVLDMVAACDVLTDTTDIAPGDVFTFYINFVKDGITYYGYHPVTNKITQSSSQSNIPGQSFNVNFLAACPFIIENFVGVYDVVETDPDGGVSEYQSTVSIDPANPDNGLICTNIWWTGDATFPSATVIYVDLDTYQISGEDQIIWGGNAWDAYGRVGMEDFPDGLANTCDFSFWFEATPTLPDPGYWWGGTATFELTPASKKSAVEERVEKSIDSVYK